MHIAYIRVSIVIENAITFLKFIPLSSSGSNDASICNPDLKEMAKAETFLKSSLSLLIKITSQLALSSQNILM